ncbi:uncharacterized protein LOC131244555 isoform X2 [Magnolia sinica]|uniref:uncharacterized protein LOC131244555 isoform X2 n=1 Tax=Magnolia sinica TaxID=86752 RepID=UPI002657D2A2|nr:uncharacterized protein LOC131244555 isoform X2 [Magnolia sinica]
MNTPLSQTHLLSPATLSLNLMKTPLSRHNPRPFQFACQVRKRPLNKELSRKEKDIVTVYDNAYLTVHEPKLKLFY